LKDEEVVLRHSRRLSLMADELSALSQRLRALERRISALEDHVCALMRGPDGDPER
jgi:hypothetical protein